MISTVSPIQNELDNSGCFEFTHKGCNVIVNIKGTYINVILDSAYHYNLVSELGQDRDWTYPETIDAEGNNSEEFIVWIKGLVEKRLPDHRAFCELSDFEQDEITEAYCLTCQ